MGAGIAWWLECWTRDWKVTGSIPYRNGRRMFFSRVNFMCWLLFWYLFCLCVTAVACKKSQSFYQRRRCQVTAKHACTLHMWHCRKWHGAWLYGVHRTCAETAAVSCSTSHVSTVSTSLFFGGYSKMHHKKPVTYAESHVSPMSLLESGKQHYIRSDRHQHPSCGTLLTYHCQLLSKHSPDMVPFNLHKANSPPMWQHVLPTTNSPTKANTSLHHGCEGGGVEGDKNGGTLTFVNFLACRCAAGTFVAL